MRIGIDASRLRTGMSGIGRYIYNILEPLDAALPGATFILYTRTDFDGTLPSGRWLLRRDSNPIWRRMPTLFWTHFRLGRLARKDRLDGFWAANTLLPAGINSVPCVATFYDLNQIFAPETMTLATRLAYKLWFAKAVKQAAFRVAISQGTSSRLEFVYGQCADAIAKPAVPLPDEIPSREEAEELICKLNVHRPYILTVGTREPRKNLATAVSAVVSQKSKGKLVTHQLIMVGARGWGRSRKDAVSFEAEWLRVLGYIDDKSLAALYLLADVFVFPSIYEGYGMPVSEAVAFGCRVVATDTPELREAGSPEVAYVEPTVEAIVHGIDRLLATSKPPPRLPSHSWLDAAQVMAEAFHQVIRRAN